MKTEIINNQKIKCYDNGGKSIDRYTAIYLSSPVTNCDPYPYYKKIYNGLSFCYQPSFALGICSHIEATIGRHLGKRIAFHDLPTDCKKAILNDINN